MLNLCLEVILARFIKKAESVGHNRVPYECVLITLNGLDLLIIRKICHRLCGSVLNRTGRKFGNNLYLTKLGSVAKPSVVNYLPIVWVFQKDA